ncbi:uncharacterized protein LOC107016786 [Solanum pennellii]|uniref:Uncharacterized protein LOC107016786 n=1 Tax=Solanum pennellii TaxID=28526 RepID=A0ABM1GL19_SOLPN|nr:uncharacterized protein LOC107016786 [Solanum pennellii]
MNPPSFTGSSPIEDPENFIEKLKKKQKDPAPSSASASAPINKGEHHGKNSQNFGARPTKSQGSVSQGGSWASVCPRCGKHHSGKCLGQTGCYKCNQRGYFMKEFPKNKQGGGNPRNSARSSLNAPPERAVSRGTTFDIGGE